MINNLIFELNCKRGTIKKDKQGHFFLSVENNIFNLMMNDGPMSDVGGGGARTVKSFAMDHELIKFLKINSEYLIEYKGV